MEKLGLLLLKANVAIIIFTLFYWLLLRRLTFYNINRVYLLFAVLFSLAYPFIQISFFSPAQLAVIPDIMPVILTQTQETATGKWLQIMSGVWLTGLLVFTFRLAGQFYSLYVLHRQSKGQLQHKNIRLVSNDISPFSFGPYIYINPSLHDSEQLNIVLLHEQVHVKEKHTLDIILVEVLFLINWFNPAAWFLRKAVKENLEYITDSKVLRKGVLRKEYQYHLLNTTCMTPALTMQNGFSIADLKKRIIQMNTEQTPSRKLLSYSFIPVLSGLLLLLNKPVQHFAEDVLGITPQQVFATKEYLPTITNNEQKVTASVNQGVIQKQRVEKNKKTLQAAGTLSTTSLADIRANAPSGLAAGIQPNVSPAPPPPPTEIIVTGYASPKRVVPGKKLEGVEVTNRDKVSIAADQNASSQNNIQVVQGYRTP